MGHVRGSQSESRFDPDQVPRLGELRLTAVVDESEEQQGTVRYVPWACVLNIDTHDHTRDLSHFTAASLLNAAH